MTPGAKQRLLGFLALGRKGGFLALGFDAAQKLIGQRGAQLLLVTQDLSPKTAARISQKAQQGGVPCRTLEATLEEMWFYLGKRVGVIAVKDRGFARALLEKIDN